jgi:hypothetical protein
MSAVACHNHLAAPLPRQGGLKQVCDDTFSEMLIPGEGSIASGRDMEPAGKVRKNQKVPKTGAKQKKRTRQERKLYDIIKLGGENEEQSRGSEKSLGICCFLLRKKSDELQHTGVNTRTLDTRNDTRHLSD